MSGHLYNFYEAKHEKHTDDVRNAIDDIDYIENDINDLKNQKEGLRIKDLYTPEEIEEHEKSYDRDIADRESDLKEHKNKIHTIPTFENIGYKAVKSFVKHNPDKYEDIADAGYYPHQKRFAKEHYDEFLNQPLLEKHGSKIVPKDEGADAKENANKLHQSFLIEAKINPKEYEEIAKTINKK